MTNTFTVLEKCEIPPEWLQNAYKEGKTIQVNSYSSVGWLDLGDDIELLEGSTYRVKP